MSRLHRYSLVESFFVLISKMLHLTLSLNCSGSLEQDCTHPVRVYVKVLIMFDYLFDARNRLSHLREKLGWPLVQFRPTTRTCLTCGSSCGRSVGALRLVARLANIFSLAIRHFLVIFRQEAHALAGARLRKPILRRWLLSRWRLGCVGRLNDWVESGTCYIRRSHIGRFSSRVRCFNWRQWSPRIRIRTYTLKTVTTCSTFLSKAHLERMVETLTGEGDSVRKVCGVLTGGPGCDA